MDFIDINQMRAEETSNNADSDGYPLYNVATSYNVGDYVELDEKIYYSLKDGNVGNDPHEDAINWQTVSSTIRTSIYDVYPQTFAKKTGGTLTYSFTLATPIDTIFIGNIYGDVVTVTVGGNTYTKNVNDGSISITNVWDIDGLDGVDDFFIDLGGMQSGTLTVSVTQRTGDAWGGFGFINYGISTSLGCTLMQTKYNVRSGVELTGQVSSLERVRSSGWQEMILQIFIPDSQQNTRDTKDIMEQLARYRGVPILIIGDDNKGQREELTFYGVYSDISASLTEWNRYSITLRSLSYKAFTPPTEIEKKKEEVEPDVLSELLYCGNDIGVGKVELKNPEINGYYENLTIGFSLNETAVDNMKLKLNNFPEIAIYKDDVAVTKNDMEKGKGYVVVYEPKTALRPIPVFNLCMWGAEPIPIRCYGGVPPDTEFTDKGGCIIFDKNNPCAKYYYDGTAVKECKKGLCVKNGVPVANDFEACDYIVDSSDKYCTHYYLDGTTVKPCYRTLCEKNGVPVANDFKYCSTIIDKSDKKLTVYYLDGATVKPRFQSHCIKNGTPTASDFKYCHYVTDTSSKECYQYYLDGGTVKRCFRTFCNKNGVPTASDFKYCKYIVNDNDPCQYYYLDSGTVKQCESIPRVTAVAGKPTTSDFNSGKTDIIFDSSNPCDKYYLDGGAVKQCPTPVSGGGSGGWVKIKMKDWRHSQRVYYLNGSKPSVTVTLQNDVGDADIQFQNAGVYDVVVSADMGGAAYVCCSHSRLSVSAMEVISCTCSSAGTTVHIRDRSFDQPAWTI